MLDFKTLKQEWHELTSYQRFEQVVSRIIMAFIAVVIVYSIVLAAIELVIDFGLGREFLEQEMLQDVFGSILTILILLEFNHSIAVSLKQKTGIIQARIVVLIAILVIARKIILLDFKTASIESLAGPCRRGAGARRALLADHGVEPPSGGGTASSSSALASRIVALLRPRLRGHRRGVGADEIVEARMAARGASSSAR